MILEPLVLRDGCPCKHTTPCHEGCSCVAPLSSSGCRRCCMYGSAEQQQTRAVFLAEAIDGAWNAIEQRVAEQHRIATASEHELRRIASLTEHELHREQRHPDYEYATTENARKSGESSVPEGEGWEPNDIVSCDLYKDGDVVEKRWRNWTRGDYTEVSYWRRLCRPQEVRDDARRCGALA
jgi:hypothetical protein